MKKRLIGAVALACVVAFSAFAAPQKLASDGPQLVPGSVINQLIDYINGTTAGVYTGTFTASGLLRTTYGTASIASGNCGTTTNGVVTGVNQSGKIVIGAVATTTCQVDFSTTLAAAPKSCVAFPGNAAAAAVTVLPFIDPATITTAHFILSGAVLASTTWNYLCI